MKRQKIQKLLFYIACFHVGFSGHRPIAFTWANEAIPQWEKRRLITPDTEKCLRLVYLCTGWRVSNKVASLPRGKLLHDLELEVRGL